MPSIRLNPRSTAKLFTAIYKACLQTKNAMLYTIYTCAKGFLEYCFSYIPGIMNIHAQWLLYTHYICSESDKKLTACYQTDNMSDEISSVYVVSITYKKIDLLLHQTQTNSSTNSGGNSNTVIASIMKSTKVQTLGAYHSTNL